MRRFVILLAVVIFVSPVVARAIQPASDASMRLESFTGVVTNGSNEVSQWTDQPITDHNATQSVAADEPTLVQSVFNGLPGLSFNNSTDYMNVAGTILSSQQFSIFAVCTDTIGNGSLREILDNWAYNTNEGTSVFFGTTGSSPDTVRFTDSDASAGTVASPSQPFVLSAMSNSNGAEVYQDQTLLSSNAALTTRNFSTPFCISRQGTTGPFRQEILGRRHRRHPGLRSPVDACRMVTDDSVSRIHVPWNGRPRALHHRAPACRRRTACWATFGGDVPEPLKSTEHGSR